MPMQVSRLRMQSPKIGCKRCVVGAQAPWVRIKCDQRTDFVRIAPQNEELLCARDVKRTIL